MKGRMVYGLLGVMMAAGLSAVAGCASAPEKQAASAVEAGADGEGAPVLVREVPPGLYFGLDLSPLAFHQEQPLFIHKNPQHHFVLRQGSAGQVMTGETPQGSHVSHPFVWQDAKGIYLLFRPKLQRAAEGVGKPGDKLVYFKASYDGGKTFTPAQRLNRRGGAFHPQGVGNGRGDLYVYWLGG